MTPISHAALRAIAFYQRRISPRKGYRCAYAVEHGGDGCSGAIRDLIRERGLVRAVVPSWRRLGACARASAGRRLSASPFPTAAGGGVQGVCCCGGIPIPICF